MISIRYYLHNKANKKGLHPLYMSVHLDGVARLQQAVGESISFKQWQTGTINMYLKRARKLQLV